MIYNILIVEDEPPSMRAISRLITRIAQRLPIRIAAQAQNGQEAFLLKESNTIDIILCDIRMPVMDGIELMERIHARASSVQAIFLTAHHDFAYMRKSLQLGMADYILKPLNEEELETALVRAINRSNERYSLSMIHYLRACMDGGNHPDIPENRHNAYLVMTVNVGLFANEEDAMYIPKDARIEPLALQNLLLKVFPECQSWILPCPSANRLISVTGIELADTKHLIATLQHSLPALSNSENVSCFFELVSHLADIPFALKHTKQAMMKQIIPGEATIGSTDAVFEELLPPMLIQGQKEALIDQLLCGHFDLFVKNIRTILLDYTLSSITQAQLLLLGKEALALVMHHVSNLSEKDRFLLESIPKDSMNVTLDRVAYINCICDSLMDFLNRFRIRTNTGSAMERIVSSVECYLMANYNQPIDLTTVAANHGVSYPYLSTMYKRYRGISPSRHIQTMRIVQAKVIIANQPGLTFKQISALVGYEDAHYFSRLFRNTTGLSLSEYRYSL